MRFASDSNGNTYRILDDGSYEKIEDTRALPCPKVEMPSPGDMAKGLAASMVSWAKAGFKQVSEKQQAARMEICLSCEKLSSDKRCSACGCFMSVKSKLAGMKCPDGRW